MGELAQAIKVVTGSWVEKEKDSPRGAEGTMGNRRDDEEYCPLYTTGTRSRETHESLKHRLRDMLGVGGEKSVEDITGATQYLDFGRQGAWMLECFMGMHFGGQYVICPYVICTIFLDEHGRPLPYPEGGGVGWWALHQMKSWA